MGLIEKEGRLEKLYNALDELYRDIEETTVTENNEAQVCQILHKRIEGLPMVKPFDCHDLYPPTRASDQTEIRQMTAYISKMHTDVKTMLEDEKGSDG